MGNLGTESNNNEYENPISEIIQGSLIDLHGANGYKSIMETMVRISGKSEKEIITNYELFAELIECIFGRLECSKIMESINLEIEKIGIKNIQQEEKSIPKKPMRLLVADDKPNLLRIYSEWLKLENRKVITVEDGQKCVEVYKKEYQHHQSKNFFDIVILDQKMPNMTGLQAAVEILKINPHQRIIFASGHLEKTLFESLTKLNKAIEVIEKPFSLEALNNMINKTTIHDELQKLNMSQEEKDIGEKLSDAMTVLRNRNH